MLMKTLTSQVNEFEVLVVHADDQWAGLALEPSEWVSRVTQAQLCDGTDVRVCEWVWASRTLKYVPHKHWVVCPVLVQPCRNYAGLAAVPHHCIALPRMFGCWKHNWFSTDSHIHYQNVSHRVFPKIQWLQVQYDRKWAKHWVTQCLAMVRLVVTTLNTWIF